MSAAKLDLVIPQGDSWSISIPVTIDGVPIDDTWTVKSQIRTSPTASSVLHQWDNDASANIVIEDGNLILGVAPQTSSAWKWVKGVYDLEISKAAVKKTVISGSVRVIQEVTK